MCAYEGKRDRDGRFRPESDELFDFLFLCLNLIKFVHSMANLYNLIYFLFVTVLKY